MYLENALEGYFDAERDRMQRAYELARYQAYLALTPYAPARKPWTLHSLGRFEWETEVKRPATPALPEPTEDEWEKFERESDEYMRQLEAAKREPHYGD